MHRYPNTTVAAYPGVYPGRVYNPHPWEQHPPNTRTRVMGAGRVRVWVWVWGEIPRGLPMPLPRQVPTHSDGMF